MLVHRPTDAVRVNEPPWGDRGNPLRHRTSRWTVLGGAHETTASVRAARKLAGPLQGVQETHRGNIPEASRYAVLPICVMPRAGPSAGPCGGPFPLACTRVRHPGSGMPLPAERLL